MISFRDFIPPNERQQGFTLLEMLLVIALLGMMALTATALVDNVDEQSRFDVTKSRLQQIKTAIVGDSTRTLNGEAEISGFVADTGSLPNCIRALIDGKCNDGDPEPLDWSLDPYAQVWSGWRGPYLQVSPESSGVTFRDGWDNPVIAGDANYGWKGYGVANEAVTLQSFGLDGVVSDGSLNVYNADYPNISGVVPNLVERLDHQVNLGSSWQSVSVKFNNTATTDKTINANTLRVRVNYPIDGDFYVWSDPEIDTPAERNLTQYLSATFPPSKIKLPSITGNITVPADTITFPSGSTLVGNTLTVPTGGEVIFADGSKLTLSGCPCVITVPSATYADPVLTITVPGYITIAPSYIAPIPATKLAKVIVAAPVGSSYSGNTLTLPLGATVTFPVGSNGTNLPFVIVEGESVTVSEAFVKSGTIVTTTVTGDTFIVPDGSLDDLSYLPATLAIPWGQRSLSVVCEDDGLVYTGDCTTSPSAPLPKPYPITLVPRKAPPLNPAYINWDIH